MKKTEIISILCELHKISGLRVSLHGTDFEEIAAYPEHRLPFCAIIQQNRDEYRRCVDCDTAACKRVMASGQTLIYKCRHGLTEVICPLYNFGTLTGYIMMGQVGDEELDVAAAERFLLELTADARLARSTALGITRISTDMLTSYVRIMTICAEYMTLTNALPSRAPRLPELAKIYLHERFGEKITIQDICRELGCSKSALLTSFKSEYGTTLNNYLCEIRINEAKRLLTSTNMSISAIADATGFYDQSYFSKVFSARLGMTPSEYRRENANEDNTHI
ncbi:MAG: PocR ligand-binding domain-containing protein [Clostridia bacterium]|nr:PocR ligand-binding domain-containing protein [Clostridia bacterium]